MASHKISTFLIMSFGFLIVSSLDDLARGDIKDAIGVFKRQYSARKVEKPSNEKDDQHHGAMSWVGSEMNTLTNRNNIDTTKEKLESNYTNAAMPYFVPLDVDSNIVLSWGIDNKERKVLFKVTFSKEVPKFDWFALGWSDFGSIESADFCLLWFSWDGYAFLQDTFTDKSGMMHKDKHNDCIESSWKKSKRTLRFSRYFDTCDNEDYIIDEGTTHIVWARGVGRPMSPSPAKTVRVQLRKGARAPPAPPPSARSLAVLANTVHVPATDTTYWCHVHEMPLWLQERPHHIIRFESQVTKGNEGLVHHMEVFYCDAAPDKVISSYRGSCFSPDRPEDTKVCTKVRAAWAMGAGPFVYPEEAGLPIGGPQSNKYFMLEVHYNNPEMRSGWVDSSGILIHLTPELRRYDAAIMELGLEYTDKMAIPPGQIKFQLSGYCTTDCTNIGLPSSGMYVFGSQLHTHLTGNKVVTRHFRNGRELHNLNKDNHYSTHFQEIRLLKNQVKVEPGDFLITTCDYNTTGREQLTFGGHSITDEMCVNYIHYYPASTLEVCKSSIGTVALANYFNYLKKWENVDMAVNGTTREKYGSVHNWHPARVDLLKSLYQESPLSMQCNASDGNRFPGEWDNVPQDTILTTLSAEPRICPDLY